MRPSCPFCNKKLDSKVSILFKEWYRSRSRKYKMFLIVICVLSYLFPFLNNKLDKILEKEFWNWYMIRRNK